MAKSIIKQIKASEIKELGSESLNCEIRLRVLSAIHRLGELCIYNGMSAEFSCESGFRQDCIYIYDYDKNKDKSKVQHTGIFYFGSIGNFFLNFDCCYLALCHMGRHKESNGNIIWKNITLELIQSRENAQKKLVNAAFDPVHVTGDVNLAIAQNSQSDLGVTLASAVPQTAESLWKQSYNNDQVGLSVWNFMKTKSNNIQKEILGVKFSSGKPKEINQNYLKSNTEYLLLLSKNLKPNDPAIEICFDTKSMIDNLLSADEMIKVKQLSEQIKKEVKYKFLIGFLDKSIVKLYFNTSRMNELVEASNSSTSIHVKRDGEKYQINTEGNATWGSEKEVNQQFFINRKPSNKEPMFFLGMTINFSIDKQQNKDLKLMFTLNTNEDLANLSLFEDV